MYLWSADVIDVGTAQSIRVLKRDRRRKDATPSIKKCRTPTGHSVIQDRRRVCEWERKPRHVLHRKLMSYYFEVGTVTPSPIWT